MHGQQQRSCVKVLPTRNLNRLNLTQRLKTFANKYVSLDARLLSVEQYRSICKLINPQLSIKACRDPQDDKFLEIALAVNASCIVTGDRNLLTLHPFCNTPILSPADFLVLF